MNTFLICFGTLVFFSVVSVRVHGLLDGLQQQTIDERFQAQSLRIQQLEQTVQNLQAQNAANAKGPIAFNAVLAKTLPNLGSHQQIVFDNVLTNVGSAYSPSHGHFTAPTKGAYAFFATLTNIPGHSIEAALLRNGASVGNILAHGTSANAGLYVTSSIATMLELHVGDEVWVQNEYDLPVEELDGGWSYFSGHLISVM